MNEEIFNKIDSLEIGQELEIPFGELNNYQAVRIHRISKEKEFYLRDVHTEDRLRVYDGILKRVK